MPIESVGIQSCLERACRCIKSEKICNRLKLTASAVSFVSALSIPTLTVAGGVLGASAHYFIHKLCAIQKVYEPFDLPLRKWKHVASGASLAAGVGVVAAISIPSSLGWGVAIGAGGVILGHVATYYDYYCLGPVPEVYDDDQVRLEQDVPMIIPEGPSAR